MTDGQENQLIDITPQGLQTPEGIRRVNAAGEEYTSATASFASAMAQFMNDYRMALIEMVSREAQHEDNIRDDWHQINSLLTEYRRKQEEFLRSVAGAPQEGQ